MKIVTKGKGIEEWSHIEGSMIVNEIGKQLHIKCNSYPHQLIVIFEDYELNKLKNIFREEGRK